MLVLRRARPPPTPSMIPPAPTAGSANHLSRNSRITCPGPPRASPVPDSPIACPPCLVRTDPGLSVPRDPGSSVPGRGSRLPVPPCLACTGPGLAVPRRGRRRRIGGEPGHPTAALAALPRPRPRRQRPPLAAATRRSQPCARCGTGNRQTPKPRHPPAVAGGTTARARASASRNGTAGWPRRRSTAAGVTSMAGWPTPTRSRG